VLPPPEEEKEVKTAIGAARAKPASVAPISTGYRFPARKSWSPISRAAGRP